MNMKRRLITIYALSIAMCESLSQAVTTSSFFDTIFFIIVVYALVLNIADNSDEN